VCGAAPRGKKPSGFTVTVFSSPFTFSVPTALLEEAILKLQACEGPKTNIDRDGFSSNDGGHFALCKTKQDDQEGGAVSTEMEDNRTCLKCGKVLATRLALQKHLTKVFLCDRKGVRRYKHVMRNTSRAHRCGTCQKIFSSAEALRYHQAKVTPCEPQIKSSDSHAKDFCKCPKCLTTFSSSQNLRFHLSRLNPCDNSTPKQHGHGNKPCPKCSATFTSAQKLRLHLTGLVPCDATQPPTPETGKEHEKRSALGQGKTQTLDLSRPEKALKSTTSLNEYLAIVSQRITVSPATNQLEKKTYHTQHNRLEAGAAYVGLQRRSAGQSAFTAHSPAYKRKRSAKDAGEEMPQVDEPRTDAVSIASATTQSPECERLNSESSSSIHGEENILVDGCCCRQCVRRWTRAMMNRLKYLNGEVTNLRMLIQNGGQGPPSDVVSVKQESLGNASCVESSATRFSQYPSNSPAPASSHDNQTKKYALESQLRSSSTRAPTVHHNSQDPPSSPHTKGVLIEKYNHANDQIITNERALEDSAAYLKEISGYDEAGSKELRAQLDELRVYIDLEKGRRDEAVALIMAQRWKAKQNEFLFLLENMSVKSKPDAEKAFHEECAEIAGQLEEKNKVLSKLGELIGTIGLNAQKHTSLKCSSEVPMPKYAIERMAKSFLERQRDDIFMCLLRCSPRIYMLTKEELSLSKKKEVFGKGE
jgi:hypothetical protein